MIVQSMTELELLDELKKDLPQISDYIVFLSNSRKYRKAIQVSKPKDNKYIFVVNDWKSRRNNHYTFILYTRSLSYLSKNGFDNATLTFIKRGNNICALRLINCDGELSLEVCTSHFIERYNQRFLKKPFLSHKETFIEYYKRNNVFLLIPLPSDVHEYNNLASVNDGYCFLKREDDNILILRTFISRDMLFGPQYDAADLVDQSLKASLAGIASNLVNIDEELDKVCKAEEKIPTMDDYNHCLELISQLHEKKKALEREGKMFDLEFYEMRNSLTLWIAGFNWAAAMLKDENGQLLKHPLGLYT